MEYWESPQFMQILGAWESSPKKRKIFTEQNYYESPISFNLYDIDDPKGIRPNDAVITFQVRCPYCQCVHFCLMPDNSNQVQNLELFYAKCTECHEIFHMLSNFRYAEKRLSPLTILTVNPDNENEWCETRIKLKCLIKPENTEHKETETLPIASKPRLPKLQKTAALIFAICVFLSLAFIPHRHHREIIGVFSLIGFGSLLLLIYKDIKNLHLGQYAAILATLLLLAALVSGARHFLWYSYELPHGYYTLLRLVTTATAAYLAFLAHRAKTHPATIITPAALILLYQPLIPVTFDHHIWCWINLITIPILLIHTHIITKPRA